MFGIQEQEERDFSPASISDIVRYQHQFGMCDYDCGACPGVAEAEAAAYDQYQAEEYEANAAWSYLPDDEPPF